MENIYTHQPVTRTGPTEPYLYLWIDTGTWIEKHQCHKRYLGIHNGSLGYAYIGSGSDFKAVYKERPEDFKRTIIMHDPDYDFIYEQEVSILKFVGASANTAWYNNIVEMNWPLQPSEKTRAKISDSLKGKKHSDETRARMSEAAKNRAPISDKTRVKCSTANKGRPKSAEHRAKMSALNKGKKLSDETRAKMTESHVARWKRLKEYKNKPTINLCLFLSDE